MYEALTLPSAFPPCGHDVNRDIAPTRRTYRLKKSASSCLAEECRNGSASRPEEKPDSDPGTTCLRDDAVAPTEVDLSAVDPILLLAGAMLAVWAVGTWFDGPGWIHILLTAGIFLWAWRVATRKATKPGKTGR